MPMLDAQTTEQVKQQLAGLAGPVQLVMFTQESECEFCADTRAMVEDVAATSDLVTAEICNFVTDKDRADSLGIDKIPAVAVVGAEDYGVRFFGIPGRRGYGCGVADIFLITTRSRSSSSSGRRTSLASLNWPPRAIIADEARFISASIFPFL